MVLILLAIGRFSIFTGAVGRSGIENSTHTSSWVLRISFYDSEVSWSIGLDGRGVVVVFNYKRLQKRERERERERVRKVDLQVVEFHLWRVVSFACSSASQPFYTPRRFEVYHVSLARKGVKVRLRLTSLPCILLSSHTWWPTKQNNTAKIFLFHLPSLNLVWVFFFQEKPKVLILRSHTTQRSGRFTSCDKCRHHSSTPSNCIFSSQRRRRRRNLLASSVCLFLLFFFIFCLSTRPLKYSSFWPCFLLIFRLQLRSFDEWRQISYAIWNGY